MNDIIKNMRLLIPHGKLKTEINKNIQDVNKSKLAAETSKLSGLIYFLFIFSLLYLIIFIIIIIILPV